MLQSLEGQLAAANTCFLQRYVQSLGAQRQVYFGFVEEYVSLTTDVFKTSREVPVHWYG